MQNSFLLYSCLVQKNIEKNFADSSGMGKNIVEHFSMRVTSNQHKTVSPDKKETFSLKA